MNNKPEVIKDWIERINDEGKDLSEWESDFMTSITDQFTRRGSLSNKQEEIVERIYTEKVD